MVFVVFHSSLGFSLVCVLVLYIAPWAIAIQPTMHICTLPLHLTWYQSTRFSPNLRCRCPREEQSPLGDGLLLVVVFSFSRTSSTASSKPTTSLPRGAARCRLDLAVAGVDSSGSSRHRQPYLEVSASRSRSSACSGSGLDRGAASGASLREPPPLLLRIWPGPRCCLVAPPDLFRAIHTAPDRAAALSGSAAAVPHVSTLPGLRCAGSASSTVSTSCTPRP